jgi:hypothetical protein
MAGLIRGLTLIRPWGWAIAHGGKDIENRTWKPPANMMGQWLAIHSGKKYDEAAASWIEDLTITPPIPEDAEDQSGVIVAVARLAEVRTESPGNPWFVGPVGWVLRDVQPIDPVPCKGAQGLWPLPPDVLTLVRARWKAARLHGGPW